MELESLWDSKPVAISAARNVKEVFIKKGSLWGEALGLKMQSKVPRCKVEKTE